MSRLPRRPSRVKPPLRGRAATQSYRGEFAPVASVRRPLKAHGTQLPMPPPQTIAPPVCPEPPTPPTDCPPPKTGLYADLVEFYKKLWILLQRINQPWQWLLIVLAIILSGLLFLS